VNTDLWLRVAALNYLSSRIVKAYADVRREAEAELTRGSRMAVYAPDGRTKLGAVSRSAPEKTAGVADVGAFKAWVKQHYPDDIEFDLEIVGAEDEVKAALYQHAKHLVQPVEKVSQSLKAAVLAASTAYGAPAGPDGELDVPGIVVSENAPSQVSFRPANGATLAVVDLVREGKVQLPDLLAESATVDGAQ
jgi:hypothetical protein